MKLALFITDRPSVEGVEIEGFINYLSEAGFSLDVYNAGEECESNPDIAISVGGDGTFLRMARQMAQRGVPVTGVNAGHLGFLTQYGLDEASSLAEDIIKGRLRVEERMILKFECAGIPSGFWPYALNEVAVLKEDTSSMLETEVYNGDKLVADYLSDGLLIATPTGSTAYSLAAGGPLVDPKLSCMLLVPVAPHTLTLRPMVTSADSEMLLLPRSRAGRCRVSLDGFSFSLATPGEIKVLRAPFTLKVLLRPGADFFGTLRQKLHWAQR